MSRRYRFSARQQARVFGVDLGHGRSRSRTTIALKCKCGRILYQGNKPPDAAVIQCQGCGRHINARGAPDVKKSPEL